MVISVVTAQKLVLDYLDVTTWPGNASPGWSSASSPRLQGRCGAAALSTNQPVMGDQLEAVGANGICCQREGCVSKWDLPLGCNPYG